MPILDRHVAPPARPRAAGGAFSFWVLAALLLLPIACDRAAPRAGDPHGAAVASTPTPQPRGPLVLYSARQRGVVEPILQRFRARSGVDVQVRYGNSHELVQALLDEGTRTPAAAFLAPNAAALGQLSRRGLLRELPMELVQEVPLRFAGTPARRDWVGITGRARVLAYNTTRVQEAALPRSLDALTDAQYRGRFGLAPPSGTFQAQMGLYRLLHDTAGLDKLLHGLRDNQPHLYASDDAMLDGLAAGEIDFALANHYDLFRERQRNPQAPVAIFFLPEGDASSFVNVAGIGVLHDDPRALDLVRFLLGKEAQQYFVRQTFEYPLAAGVPPLQPLPALAGVRTPEIDYSDISAVLTETQRALRRSGLLSATQVTTPPPEEGVPADEEGARAAPAPTPQAKPAAKGKHAAAKPASRSKKPAPEHKAKPAARKKPPVHHHAKKKPPARHGHGGRSPR